MCYYTSELGPVSLEPRKLSQRHWMWKRSPIDPPRSARQLFAVQRYCSALVQNITFDALFARVLYLNAGDGKPCTGHSKPTICLAAIVFFIPMASLSFALGGIPVRGSTIILK